MMSQSVHKIAIIGLGLMGGSLALAFSRAGLRVSGWDQDLDSIRQAHQNGAISEMPADLGEAISNADIVFVATPVEYIPNIIRRCLPYTLPGTIFSDLGSIKGKIVEEVQTFLPSSHYYIPGHPMTGSEQQGIGAADPFLFQNAAYILIEDSKNPRSKLDYVIQLVQITGAHVLTLTAAEHDRIVGMVSHLPHLIAATLTRTAGKAECIHPGTLALAAGGFRDTTRIATGSPALWEGIIHYNKKWIVDALEAFQEQLSELKTFLNQSDTVELRKFLTEAKEVRHQIPAKSKGFLTLLYEMVVTIEDRPGTIEAVLHHLAQSNLNIKDIEILRVREGDGGTLRLALESNDDVDKAVQLLQEKGFKAKRR